jgi:hypothetical protein
MTQQFEDQLRDALRPVEPPADFADRVLARIDAGAPPGASPDPRSAPAEVIPMRPRRVAPVWVGVAAAAALTLAGGAGYYVAAPRPADAPTSSRVYGPTEDEVPRTPAPELRQPPPETTAAPEPRPVAPSAPRPVRRSVPARAARRAPESRPALTAEAIHARQQLMRALAITGSALDAVERTVTTRDEVPPTSGRRTSDDGTSR